MCSTVRLHREFGRAERLKTKNGFQSHGAFINRDIVSSTIVYVFFSVVFYSQVAVKAQVFLLKTCHNI